MSIQDRIASLNLGQVSRGPAPLTATAPVKPCLHHSVSTQDVSYTSGAIQHQPTVSNMPNGSDYGKPPPQRAEKKRIPLPPPRPSYSRTSSNAPSLPARKGSNPTNSLALSRRESQESISSTATTRSSISGPSIATSATSISKTPPLEVKNGGTLRAPTYDPSSLPPLPPKRSDPTVRPGPKPSTSSNSLHKVTSEPAPSPAPALPSRRGPAQPGQPPPPTPPRRDTALSLPETAPARSLPPPLPVRRESETSGLGTTSPLPHRDTAKVQDLNGRPKARPPALPGRTQSGHVNGGEPAPRKSALSFAMNRSTEQAPPIPSRPDSSGDMGGAPPPIPTASRPNLAALQASKPKLNGASYPATLSAPQGTCMKCRDFSGPDGHSSRFPREGIPTQDTSWLAHALADPFPSLTDKARALYTWMHHNIAYDTKRFFSGNLQASTPASTIASGLAVCEGYASLFATFAMHLGMEAVVVSGHGMGYSGKKDFVPGQPLPEVTGHAWNVVRIDNGEWKLIDPCWGAGHIADDQTFHKSFHPEWFCMSNEEFGLKHYPQNKGHFYRSDGRIPSLEEYWLGPDSPAGGTPKVTVYTGCREKHGLNEQGFQPPHRFIQTRGVHPKQRVQFMMETVCEHWDNQRMGQGKPYVMLLSIGGKDGRGKKQLPFQTNGRHWWLDVAVEDLGCAGQTVSVNALTTVDGQDGRGLTPRDYEAAVGRKGMSWSGVAAWQLS